MSTSVGSILAGAFRQVRDRPFAVLVWSLIYAIVTVAMMFAMLPFMQAQQSAAAAADPVAAMSEAAGMLGWIFLLNLAFTLVFLWLLTASMRATLRPQEPGVAYLRFGADEFNMFLLGLIFAGVFVCGYIGMVIVLALLAALGALTSGVAGAVAMAVFGVLAVFAVLIWFQTRYSLTFAISLMRGRVVLGEAWRLSKGQFWTLFGAYLLIGLLLLALWIVVTAVTMGPYYAMLLRGGLDQQALEAAAAAQMAQQMAGPTPMVIAGWVLNGAVGGLAVALGGGAVATAARDLAPEGPAIALEFA